MLNNCTFQGRFAADPEMRTTQSGLTVASFRMAVDRDNVGQDGRRATDWLNFVAWRKTAEFVCQYFRKGQHGSCGVPVPDPLLRRQERSEAHRHRVCGPEDSLCGPKTEQRVDDGGEAPPPGYQQPSYQNQQPQQMGFSTQSQRQQWQGAKCRLWHCAVFAGQPG